MTVAAVNAQTQAAASLALGGNRRAMAGLPQADQVKAVSMQFESILLRQFLQESVGNIMGQGPSGNVYGYMLTDLLATKLSEGGGLGLANILQHQLTPRAGRTDAAGGDTAKGSS